MDREAPRRRPPGWAQGWQRWDRLLFCHWEVPAEALRPLVDGRLALDSWGGRYYVGLVAFEMQRVWPFWYLPPVPTARRFAEVNLRTYVHLDGAEPGVWFFSLEASSLIAVLAARLGWSLPYFYGRVERHDDQGGRIGWRLRRRWPQPAPALIDVDYQVGAVIEAPQPGSLEHFLVERYQLYTASRGQLVRARVHHPPYPLCSAQIGALDTDLVRRAGLPDEGARTPDYFSPGVDVEIFPMTPVP